MILVSTPTGRLAYAGFDVPFELIYKNEDGSAPTRAQFETARHCGPGFVRPTLKTVSFATEAEAIAAAAGIGLCEHGVPFVRDCVRCEPRLDGDPLGDPDAFDENRADELRQGGAA